MKTTVCPSRLDSFALARLSEPRIHCCLPRSLPGLAIGWLTALGLAVSVHAQSVLSDDDGPSNDDVSQAYATDAAWRPPAPASITAYLQPAAAGGLIPKTLLAAESDDGVLVNPGVTKSETRYTQGFDLFNGNLRILQYASAQGTSSATSKIMLSSGASALGQRRNWFKVVATSSAAKNVPASTTVTATLLGQSTTVSVPSDQHWSSSAIWSRATRTYDAGDWLVDLNDIARKYLGFSVGLPPFPIKMEIVGEAPVVTIKPTPHRSTGGVLLEADAQVAITLRATTRSYRFTYHELTITFRPEFETKVLSAEFGGSTNTEIQLNRPGLKNGVAVKHVSDASAKAGGGALKVIGGVQGYITVPWWGRQYVDFDFSPKLFSVGTATLAEKLLLNFGGKILY